MNQKRITLFAGHYGSGKTNIAVNYAIDLKEKGYPVIIADLDIVNPYFRTKDSERELAQAGIKLISSEFANSNLDIPTVPQEVKKCFYDTDREIVFDVGGDDEGATVLGMFNRYLLDSGYEMYLVLNTKRPFTENLDDTIEMINAIEYSSRLKFTGIVSNSNLMEFTTPEIVAEGEKLSEKISEKSGIPLKFISATEKTSGLIKNKDKYFKIDFYIKKPF